MVSTYWLKTYPNIAAEFTIPTLSDHCAGSLFSNRTVQRVDPFKFFNFLIRHKDFLATVQQGWNYVQPFGDVSTL